MELKARGSAYIVPDYSLTGDLLSFHRCGLQYRMYNVGKLPSTRPVQMWFGQFIHGVLEESFREFQESSSGPKSVYTPPSVDEIRTTCDLVIKRLAAQGLKARNSDLVDTGIARATAAVQILGPALFPLIKHAEVKLTGTRRFPDQDSSLNAPAREADRYEMKGVVDVVTSVELGGHAFAGNFIVEAVRKALPNGVSGSFEVIIDYKGMHRPTVTKNSSGSASLSEVYDWQLQTYAELRGMQLGSLPVAAGILIYLNELLPSWNDVKELKKSIANGTTDVVPLKGSAAEIAINSPRTGSPYPEIPLEFRVERALRVIAITPQTQEVSARKFDEFVAQIESSRTAELATGNVVESWKQDSSDEATCTACDWRPICPSYNKGKTAKPPKPPRG
jgi:hypothetical protein